MKLFFLGIPLLCFSFVSCITYAEKEIAESIEYKEGIVLDIEEPTKKIENEEIENEEINPQEERIYTIEDTKTKTILRISENIVIFRGDENRFQNGDTIMYSKNKNEIGETSYLVHDHVRLGSIIIWILAFLVFTLLITKGKSIGSLVGLILSIFILYGIMLPALQGGKSPILWGFISAILISGSSLYLSHGFRKSTTLSILSVWITVFFCFLLGILAIDTVHLFGFGEETASVLVMNGMQFDFQGILLAGILLAGIGIIDDVVSTQIEALIQLKKTNSNITYHELWNKGISIGNEHIFSMINTLVLVYFSASMCGMLLLFSSQADTQMILNSEMISEEIIRTLIGSFGIVLAVPISTGLGVWAIQKKIF